MKPKTHTRKNLPHASLNQVRNQTRTSLPKHTPSARIKPVQGYYPQPRPSKTQSQQKPLNRTGLQRIALLFLVSVFLFAVYQISAYFIHSHRAKQEEAMIRTLIAETSDNEVESGDPSPVVQNTPSPAPTALPKENVYIEPEPKAPETLTQFSKPLLINPDTVGKLKLGESIDTYVVQRDNSYYLRRSFTGEYNFSGAIFLDVTCSIFPQSRMLIIHGHNMKDGTAFGKLSRYDSLHYLNQYPVIRFSTLYESGEYQPFAAVYYSTNPKADNYLDLYQGNYLSDEAFIAFIQKAQSMSVYRISMIVKPKDKIIVLTTCATDDPDMRFALFAVKRNMV